MSDFGNKQIFSENLRRYMKLSGKRTGDIISDLGVKESTFYGWYRAEYYPRMDKIELMAKYFGCTKTDLIEKQSENYTVGSNVKNAIDTINSNATKHELMELVLSMETKDAEVLLTVARQLTRRNENETN